jgi:hypothetical protein
MNTAGLRTWTVASGGKNSGIYEKFGSSSFVDDDTTPHVQRSTSRTVSFVLRYSLEREGGGVKHL